MRLVVNGVMTVLMRMEMVSTGVPRPRVVVGAMPGRVMVRLRGLSWVRQEALLRGHPVREIDTAVVSAVIMVAEAVEVAGIIHDSLIRPLWSSRRPLAGLSRSLGCLPRLWRW